MKTPHTGKTLKQIRRIEHAAAKVRLRDATTSREFILASLKAHSTKP